MARIRTVKPSFFLHEGLAELSAMHRLFFIGLWVIADKEGRMEYRPKRIKAEIFPWDDCDVGRMLEDLDSVGLVHIYDVGDDRFIAIPAFGKHQRPHPKEAKSDIPEPPCRVIKRLAVERFSITPDHYAHRSAGKEIFDNGKEILESVAKVATVEKQPRKTKPEKPPDPRHAPMVARLTETFQEIRKGKYAFDGKDAKAVALLLSKGTDDEIDKHWRRGLNGAFKERCDTLMDLAQRWNALTGQPAPPARAGNARFVNAQDSVHSDQVGVLHDF